MILKNNKNIESIFIYKRKISFDVVFSSNLNYLFVILYYLVATRLGLTKGIRLPQLIK